MEGISENTFRLAKELKGKKLTKTELQIVWLFENSKGYQLVVDDHGNICAKLITKS